MKLNEPWFELVKSGKKIYEGRRNTEFCRQILPGDLLFIQKYKEPENSEGYYVEVLTLEHFNTFQEALNRLPIDQILPIPNITVEKGVEIYYQYVSLNTQLKDGIIMIKIKPILKPINPNISATHNNKII